VTLLDVSWFPCLGFLFPDPGVPRTHVTEYESPSDLCQLGPPLTSTSWPSCRVGTSRPDSQALGPWRVSFRAVSLGARSAWTEELLGILPFWHEFTCYKTKVCRFFCSVVAGSKCVECHVLLDGLPGCVSADNFLSFSNRHNMLIWCLLLNTFYFKRITPPAAFICGVCPFGMSNGAIFRAQLPMVLLLISPWWPVVFPGAPRKHCLMIWLKWV